MSINRRDLLKGLGALGAFGVCAAGLGGTVGKLKQGWWAGLEPENKLAGTALAPEASIDPVSGQVTLNANQWMAHGICYGCTSICGVRLRVDAATGQVLRVSGNPYHPQSADPIMPYATSAADCVKKLSAAGDEGHRQRATACGRGNAVLDKLTDPYRLLTPLKRVGPRGSGQWQPISFEQLVQEVCYGGDLFAEGHVDGLAALRDLNTPLDADNPEFGPKANKLVVNCGYGNGRIPFAQRFTLQSFGSINFVNHQGNCGLTMRAGYAALLGDFREYPHLKPDLANCRFYLCIGTAPGNAGNPYMMQGIYAARGRAEDGMKVVVVDPVLTNADNLSAGESTRWIPVKPGTDSAFAMALIRILLEDGGANTAYLSLPGPAAAKVAGEPSSSNATHLVISQPGHPQHGRFVRAKDMGLSEKDDVFVAVSAEGGQLVPSDGFAGPCALYVDREIELSGVPVRVKSSLTLLLEAAREKTVEEYAAVCGVGPVTLRELAAEFAAAGYRAVADCHGGTMHAAGFETAYAVVMLNALAGNLNRKGGTTMGAPGFPSFGKGPRYDFTGFPGQVQPKGVRLSRQGFAYEKTSEFARIKAAGGNPYPAKAPWYPFSNSVQSEYYPSAVAAYPYKVGCFIHWNTNPVYGQSGLLNQLGEGIKDPKKIPLVVTIEPFMSETAMVSDYVLPDNVLYESYAVATPWAANVGRVSTVAWPVAVPPQARTADGQTVNMESFFLAVAQKLALPGFGKAAMKDAQGQALDIQRAEDFYLRAIANVAFAGQPVADAAADDLAASGLARIMPDVKKTLTEQEVPKAALVLARGGRFEPLAKGYEGECLVHAYPKQMQIYNEIVATTVNSQTGKRFRGTPCFVLPRFSNGVGLAERYPEKDWPLQLVSTKSQLMAAGAMGAAKLSALRPVGYVAVSAAAAAALGIASGDLVRLETPGGAAQCRVVVRHGLAPNVVAVEHGFGHLGFGGRGFSVGDARLAADPARAAGLLINTLGLSDEGRSLPGTLCDPATGANARTALPARLAKLA